MISSYNLYSTTSKTRLSKKQSGTLKKSIHSSSLLMLSIDYPQLTEGLSDIQMSHSNRFYIFVECNTISPIETVNFQIKNAIHTHTHVFYFK